MFFALSPAQSCLSDCNSELVTTYEAIRDAAPEVEAALTKHALSHSDTYFYTVRAQTEPGNNIAVAARFLYLNRTCWNGLYRVNQKGIFNVPRGTKDRVLLDTDDFAGAAARLLHTKIRCEDFEYALGRVTERDFAFVDPPYTTAHNLNGFIKYNDRIFTWSDQLRLRTAVAAAASRGANILITNANHSSLRELYDGLGTQITLSRPSVISGSASGRGATTELAIAIGYIPENPLEGHLECAPGSTDGSSACPP